jgi:hypothetical protein
MKNNVGSERSWKVFICFWLLIAIPAAFCNLARADTAIDEFRALIADVKTAINQNNMAFALQLLEQASTKLDELERRPVLEEEALRWDLAQINLDRADSMQNRSQIAEFANRSIERWREYVRWRSSLTDVQIEIVQRNPKSDRIQSAVRLMGNAYMRRENLESFSIRDLFSEYVDTPPGFMSSKSIDLWINWLFRCPSWDEVENASFQQLGQRLKTDANVCREDWTDFHDYLQVWLEEQQLSAVKKKRYERRLRDLEAALEDHE